MTIGERIKELRNERGLTQIAFAEIFNIDKSTIAKYETNKNYPSIPMIIAMCKYFSVPSDYILCLTD